MYLITPNARLDSSMEEDIKVFYVKEPSTCSTQELRSFYELVLKGEKVDSHRLLDRIKNCKLLGFCSINNKIIAISAIKVPNENYRRHVVKSANINRKWNELDFEIGYSYTEEKLRGNRINPEIKRKLLENINKGLIFSTTAIPTSQKFLEKNGFINKGEPYDGKTDKNIKYYEKELKPLFDNIPS